MEAIIKSFCYNTENGNIYVYVGSTKKQLKYFLNFKNEKIYFVGTEKNKTIFSNLDDINKINNFLKN